MQRKNDSGEYDFGIYEVFCDDNGKVVSWTKESMTPVCRSEEALDYELNLMREALKKDTVFYIED